MKKYIALSLLITSSTFMHAMEDDNWSLSSLSSRFSAWLSSGQISNESKLISDLRRSKDDFERKLLSNQEQVQIALKRFPLGDFLKSARYPIWLLQYCYYQEIIRHLDENLSLIATLPFCKNMQINGYTALGAAIISREPSIDKKRFFIQNLLNSGFELTPEDIKLAELTLYDEVTKQQKTILHFLHVSSDYWFVLPQEIRQLIIRYMIDSFKNEVWLLPKTV